MRRHHRVIVLVSCVLVGLAGATPAQAFLHKKTIEDAGKAIKNLGKEVLPAPGPSSGKEPSKSGAVDWSEPGTPGADPYFRSTFNQALESARTGSGSPWRNPKTGERGVITPTATFQGSGGAHCRNYRWTLVTGASSRLFEGTACRAGKQNWQVREETERQSTVAGAASGDTPWLSGQGAAQQPGAATSQPSYNGDKQMVADSQRMLNELGYNAGDIDGLYGNQTRRAIKAFQKDRGLPAEGNVTAQLFDSLRAAQGGEQAEQRPVRTAQPLGSPRVLSSSGPAPIAQPSQLVWHDASDFEVTPGSIVVITSRNNTPRKVDIVKGTELTRAQEDILLSMFEDEGAWSEPPDLYSAMQIGFADDAYVISAKRYAAFRLSDVTRRVLELPGSYTTASASVIAAPPLAWRRECLPTVL